MAKLVYGMNQSLDGYADHQIFNPDPVLFRYFIGSTGSLSGSIYGRRMYEVMRYWDDDQAGWSPDEQEYARAWRKTPKWVVSKTLETVGPNATLISGNMKAALRDLKTRLEGEIGVGGPALAGSLGRLGLIDEYRLYFRPFVLGSGVPFFSGQMPPLELAAAGRIGEDAVRLTYVPG